MRFSTGPACAGDARAAQAAKPASRRRARREKEAEAIVMICKDFHRGNAIMDCILLAWVKALAAKFVSVFPVQIHREAVC